MTTESSAPDYSGSVVAPKLLVIVGIGPIEGKRDIQWGEISNSE